MYTEGNSLFWHDADGVRREFDMRLIHQAQRRLVDVRIVTPVKAPELLGLFLEAFDLAGDYYCLALEAVEKAKARQERIKAQLILDELPEYAQKKGLASARSPLGAEDIRTAFVNAQTSYADLVERTAQMKAIKELMALKMSSFEHAQNDIKKILDSRFGNPQRTPDIGGREIPDEAEAGTEVETAPTGTQTVRGWGKPKYE